MRDIAAELKSLRLYGMMNAWEEVAADKSSVGIQASRWLIERAGPGNFKRAPTRQDTIIGPKPK